MRIKVLDESGYQAAINGTMLSYGVSDYDNNIMDLAEKKDNAERVMRKLSGKDGGHDKFLRFLTVYLAVDAPLYWWKEFDTYKVGVEKLSESTMHTLMKRSLTLEDFEGEVHPSIVGIVNEYIKEGDFRAANANLPQSFLQTRIICTNYAALVNIIAQRHAHKLKEWHTFCKCVVSQLKHRHIMLEALDKRGVRV